MTFEINVLPLPEAMDQLVDLDKRAMPKEMWLEEEELDGLKNSYTGVAVLVIENDVVLAGAYALAGTEVKDSLEEFDPNFTTSEKEAYIYSVATAPESRRKQLGTMLRRRLATELKDRGFITGCSHITMEHDWHLAGRATYHPHETRTVKNYWPESKYPDVEFQRFTLP